MGSPAALYHITPENLALRREFIGLDADVLALLSELAPWANEVADVVAAELTDHHLEGAATGDFLASTQRSAASTSPRCGRNGARRARLTGGPYSPRPTDRSRSASTTSRAFSRPERHTTG